MTDNLDAKGRIELEVIAKGLDQSVTQLGRFNEETGHTVKAATRAEAATNKVAQSLRGEALASATATKASKDRTQSLIAQRYALYDVATTYGVVGAALLAADVYAIKLAADFESAFTSVERTSEGSIEQIEGLRDTLIELSTQIPLSFQELSKIAALGNQLGIPASAIESFTEIVAQFSAVTGITADAAAQAFGRLQNILGITSDDFDNLASAIVYTARTSAATEPQIIALAQRLGATATRAGFTAAEVIGLSGALASLAVAPERAQGVLETYFNRLNTAVAEGGQDLTHFAQVAGLTESQVSDMVRSGSGLDLLSRILTNLPASTVDQTTALQALGLEGLRASEVFGRLAGNGDLLKQQIEGSVRAYQEAAEIQRQYALVADDLNSKFMMLVNSVNALIEAASGGNIAGLAGTVQALIDMTNAVRAFVETDAGGAIAKLIITLTVAAGVFLLYRTAVALATASTFALVTAQQGLAAAGFATGIRGLAQAIGLVKVSADGATVSTLTLRGALLALGRATIIIALLQALSEVLFNTDETFRSLAQIGLPVVQGLQPIFNIASQIFKVMSTGAGILATVEQAMVSIGGVAGRVAGGLSVFARASQGVFALLSSISGASGAVGQVANGVNGLGGASGALNGKLAKTSAAAESASAGVQDFGSSSGGAAKQVRTLVDYANDLSSVLSRAFEIRFGGDQALDAITSGWLSMAAAIEEANTEIAEHSATMQTLTADRAIKEYWLSVAENYGDALRAGELRAELAEIDNDLTKSAKDLQKAQAKGSKTLVGDTQAAIDNRAEILGLVGDYQAYIAALASSGLEQSELQAKTAEVKQAFIDQATQLGYNEVELQKYAKGFDDVATAIGRVPRNVTVTANADPAIQAINELESRLRALSGQSYSGPNITGGSVSEAARKALSYAAIQAEIDQLRMVGAAGLWSNTARMRMEHLQNQLRTNSYAEGGYTGGGGKYEPAGIVHKGEFVFSKQATQNIGVGNLAYAHRMAKTGKGYADGGYASSRGSAMAPSGPAYVQLSPYDRQLLVDIRDSVGITIAPAALQGAVNGSNANSATRRSA